MQDEDEALVARAAAAIQKVRNPAVSYEMLSRPEARARRLEATAALEVYRETSVSGYNRRPLTEADWASHEPYDSHAITSEWEAIRRVLRAAGPGARLTATEISQTLGRQGIEGWTWENQQPPSSDWAHAHLAAAYQRGKVNRKVGPFVRGVYGPVVWWLP